MTFSVHTGGLAAAKDVAMEWQPIATAPFACDLELAVIKYDGIHALVFPCRRILGGWMNPETKMRITVYPTHWREWHGTLHAQGRLGLSRFSVTTLLAKSRFTWLLQ
jgi:hypothetical protein